MVQPKKNEKLDALKSMEQSIESVNQDINQKKPTLGISPISEQPNTTDGYIVIETDDLPHKGLLYPETWNFAYRSPTAKEVANFSTINERDQPAIINLIEDLIRKCVVIFDTAQNKQIDAGNINDCHRTFFLLKLREAYLPGNPITYDSVCTFCKDSMDVFITADSLVFEEINEKLLSAFDGRKFSLKMPEVEKPIEFLIPTINFSSKIFKHLVKAFRDGENNKQKREDKILYDKQFLLFAPYLHVDGDETVSELKKRYLQITSDENLYKAYLEIINKLDLDNKDFVENKHSCGSMEEAQIRFPGGWKKLFISNESSSGYFD